MLFIKRLYKIDVRLDLIDESLLSNASTRVNKNVCFSTLKANYSALKNLRNLPKNSPLQKRTFMEN